jgi:hypothetical protein
MKRASVLEKPRHRRNTALIPVRSTSSRRGHQAKWLVMPDVDEGPDAAFREVIQRIVRGDRIRGHAL